MGVEVNEAGHHDEAARIDDLRALEGEAGADGDDLAGAKPDIGDRVAPVRRIDDPTPLRITSSIARPRVGASLHRPALR
jgi:hypothetical protein